MFNIRFYIFILVAITCSQCNVQRVQKLNLIGDTHQVIAFLPPELEFEKPLVDERLLNQIYTESMNLLENGMYKAFMESTTSQTDVRVIPPEEVFQRLSENGYFSDEEQMSSVEICELLNADALIETYFFYNEPPTSGEVAARIGADVLTSVLGIGTLFTNYDAGNFVFLRMWLFDRNMKADIISEEYKQSRTRKRKFDHNTIALDLIDAMMEDLPYRLQPIE